MENVSRETSGAPSLFWRQVADDPDLPVEHKTRWLTASYQYCLVAVGITAPDAILAQTVGLAAALARLIDQLLAAQGVDPLLDQFTVSFLCMACDTLWAYVPDDLPARGIQDYLDDPIFAAYLPAETYESGIAGRVGVLWAVACPRCSTPHIYKHQIAACSVCGVSLLHIQPMPYPIARRRDR